MKPAPQFSTLIQNLPKAVYTCDELGFVKLYNKAAADLWGREPVIGKDLWDGSWRAFKTDGSFQHLNNTPLARAIRENKPIYGEDIIIQRPDGSFRYVTPFPSPLLDNLGNVMGGINILVDVTNEKGGHDEVNEKYRRLSEQSDEGVFFFDNSGNFVSANIRGCNMLEFNKEEISTLHITDLVPENHCFANTNAHNKSIPSQFEKRIIRRNKTPLFAEVSTQLMPVGIVKAIIRDISEKKESEEKLLKANERYELLAKATSDTIWDWDLLTNTISYNEGINKKFGYSTIKVDNPISWWKENIHATDWQKVADTLDEVFTKKIDGFQLTYLFKCADGSYKSIYDRAFVIFDKTGNPSRIIGAMQDLTYLRQEEIRVINATLEAQESERQQIGFELHDNVNQILTGCLLNLGIVKNATPAKAAELVEKSKEYILTAINEIRKLSHQLAPTHIEKGSIKKAFEVLIQFMNVNNQFETKVHFDSFKKVDISDEIHLNLYRILQEQLTNIVKYAKASKIEVSLTLKNDTICLRVADNGIGFNVAAIKTGIGLTNIKKRAQVLSGNFKLSSAPGQGCVLSVTLPLNNNGSKTTGKIASILPFNRAKSS